VGRIQPINDMISQGTQIKNFWWYCWVCAQICAHLQR